MPIQTQNLSIGYGGTTVADGIDLQLQQGKLTAVVGPNGAGKSTLLRTLCKEQPAVDGTVHLNGRELKDYSFQELARQLSVVLTESPASGNLTVEELVAIGRQPYTNWLGKLTETDRKQVQRALRHTQTESLKMQKCHTLSDGQLQRVMIARALAQDTPIILLDEPTTHLDLYHRVLILNLLKKLAQTTEKTILFATHEIELSLQLCDTMLVIAEGKAHFGTPENLIKNGCFDALFPKELLIFDTATKTFRVVGS